jgi:hypothetical protein
MLNMTPAQKEFFEDEEVIQEHYVGSILPCTKPTTSRRIVTILDSINNGVVDFVTLGVARNRRNTYGN